MNPKQPTIISLGLEALRRLFADEAIPLAGNIAFRTLFSIFPFLIFLTALAGFFGNADLAEKVVGFLLSVAPEQLVHPLGLGNPLHPHRAAHRAAQPRRIAHHLERHGRRRQHPRRLQPRL